MTSATTWLGLRAGPPKSPECRSRSAAMTVNSSPTRPRSMMVIAGRVALHMLVSQTSATSARSSAALAARNCGRLALPDSSSPFEDHRHLDRKRAGDLDPGAAGLDEGHELALVVGRAAGDDPLLAADGDKARLEGRRGPFRQRVDRLDVVMGVEQDVRIARTPPVMGDDHGVAGGGPDGCVEAETDELVGEPVGRGADARRIGGVGRDAFDPEKPEQPVEARGQILRRSSSEPHQAWRLLSRWAATLARGREARKPAACISAAPGVKSRGGVIGRSEV